MLLPRAAGHRKGAGIPPELADYKRLLSTLAPVCPYARLGIASDRMVPEIMAQASDASVLSLAPQHLVSGQTSVAIANLWVGCTASVGRGSLR